ncbi:MAG TPA: hypothetical protein VGC99_16825 [Candidatus Tectomicrobia bacterium]
MASMAMVADRSMLGQARLSLHTSHAITRRWEHVLLLLYSITDYLTPREWLLLAELAARANAGFPD